MMLTIHGLAPATKYQDLKLLIKQTCNINDFILDNLIAEPNGTKKVRIGLPDDSEGFKLMKCLNGYRMSGNFILKVLPVSKPAASAVPIQTGFNSGPGYQGQQRNDYMNNDYNRDPNVFGGPQGPGGMQASNKPYPQHPMDNTRPSPWSDNTSAQWGPNASMSAQMPQSSFGFGTKQHNVPPQQPRQVDSRNLRSIQTVDNGHQAPTPMHGGHHASAPMHGGRYPPNQHQQTKPGPTQYNITHPGRHQPQTNSPSWQQHPHQAQQPKSQFPAGVTMGYEKPFENRNYPPLDQSRDPKNLQSRPDTHKEYEKRRGFSPPGRRDDPMLRRDDPMQRRDDPMQRRDDPIQRRDDPMQRRDDPMQRRDDSMQRRDDSMQRRDDPMQRKDDPMHRRDDPMHRGVDTVPRRNDAMPRRDDPMQRRDDPMHRRDVPIQRKDDPMQRRDGPMQRRDDPMQRRISPPRGKEVPAHRDVPGRIDNINQRRLSPTRMGDTMHRRVSPQGRRDDTYGRVNTYSPSEKTIIPGDRRNIPGNVRRHDSPPGRQSPGRRPMSPGGRDEMQTSRFSPSRRYGDKTGDKYGDIKDLKKVRPAYEVPSHAPNQAMYSGGYRPNIHDNAKYPAPGRLQEEAVSWQRHRDEQSMKKQDDRLDARIPQARAFLADKLQKRYSPTRKSRSPNRRDRSPIRDSYRRNSRSPRSSHSPRRSWALEKRRSPDAPPPPLWPGQAEHSDSLRAKSVEKVVKPVRQPVWEGRSFKEDEVRDRRPDDRRHMIDRNPQDSMNEPHYKREPKFSPRDTFDERLDNYRREPEPKMPSDDLPRRVREGGRPEDYDRRAPSPYRDVRQDVYNKDFNKDFEDIYNRALLFKKKAEQMRKSSSKKIDEFEDSHEKERENLRQRYEDRLTYREEESHRLRMREDIMRDDRARDERPPGRDVRPPSRDERARDQNIQGHDDRSRYQPRETQHERSKTIDDNKAKQFYSASDSVKQKRTKAVAEIAEKIIEKSEEYKGVQGEQRSRMLEQLNLAVFRIIYDMFGDSDVSFIEMIIKYQARYTLEDEAKLLRNAIESLPKPFRTIKRHIVEPSDQPAKISRFSPSDPLKSGQKRAPMVERPKPQRSIDRRQAVKQEASQQAAKPKLQNEAKKVIESPKKLAEVKSTSLPDKSCGSYELNELMTRMVDAELDHIIPKVREVIGDVLPSETELLDVDTIRDKVSDDLRNILGLNITKRLLNVHNPLYVKIKFNGKPEKEDLRGFLKKYHFTAFARKAVNIFAARVRSMEDFDNLFSGETVQCGNIKVTVDPVYRFSKCPPNLITKYKDIEEEHKGFEEAVKVDTKRDEKTTSTLVNKSKTKPNAITQQNDKVVNTSKSASTPQKSTTEKSASQFNVTPQESLTGKSTLQSVTKVASQKPTAVMNISSQSDVKPQKSTVENITAPPKLTPYKSMSENITPQSKTIPLKPEPQKSTNVVVQIESKSSVTSNNSTKPVTIIKPNAGEKATVAQPQNSTKTIIPTESKSSATSNSSTKSVTTTIKTNAGQKENVAQPEQSTKTITPTESKPSATSNNSTKSVTPTIKTNAGEKANVAQPQKLPKNITPTQSTIASKNSSKLLPIKKSTTDESDFDELDDHDILAMISEGIVLDECSGSEED